MPRVNQTPEQKARDNIDAMLEQAGWFVQDKKKIDFSAGFGITVREYQTDIGPADYVLFIDKNPIGVIEAKSANWGQKITTVEEQSAGYATARLKWQNDRESLPFVYESTGVLRSNPPVMLLLGSSGRTIESPCHLFMKVPACLRASPTCAIRSRAPGKCSASLGQRGYGIGSASRTHCELGSGGFWI